MSKRSSSSSVRDSPPLFNVVSTGLSIVGEGEWAAAKHRGKGRRGWKKLHLSVDGSGVIVVQAHTDGIADGAKTGLNLIEAVDGHIERGSAPIETWFVVGDPDLEAAGHRPSLALQGLQIRSRWTDAAHCPPHRRPPTMKIRGLLSLAMSTARDGGGSGPKGGLG